MAGVSEVAIIETPREPSPLTLKWRAFHKFLYNKTDRTYMGRTGTQWAQIIGFYIAFYGFLAAFFAVALHLFLMTLDDKQPRWQKDMGLLGTMPGMGFRPKPPDPESQLIWINKTTKQQYVDKLKEYLEPYKNQMDTNGPLIDCSPTAGPTNATLSADYVCKAALHLMGPCAEQYDFGYTSNQPCVLVKINKIYDWMPAIPPFFPNSVTEYQQKFNITGGAEGHSIPVTCEGETELDTQLLGPLAMYPSTISSSYFPYLGQSNYLAPFVMLQFLDLTVDVVIAVRCKFWVTDVVHDVGKGLATVGFQILLNGD